MRVWIIYDLPDRRRTAWPNGTNHVYSQLRSFISGACFKQESGCTTVRASSVKSAEARRIRASFSYHTTTSCFYRRTFPKILRLWTQDDKAFVAIDCGGGKIWCGSAKGCNRAMSHNMAVHVRALEDVEEFKPCIFISKNRSSRHSSTALDIGSRPTSHVFRVQSEIAIPWSSVQTKNRSTAGVKSNAWKLDNSVLVAISLHEYCCKQCVCRSDVSPQPAGPPESLGV